MRSRQVLKEKFNKIPRPESVLQNQWLLMEILMDIRDMLYGKQDGGFKAPWENDSKDIEQTEELDFIDKKDEPI